VKPIDRGTWLALGAMGVAVFVLANDFSAINVAIPQIERDFETDVTTAQWVVNAYALTFGVLLVTAAAWPISSAGGRRSSSAPRSSRPSRCSAAQPRARPG
jgi:predicted MFS family arabinose efflux permease